MYEYLSFKLGGELSGTDWANARIEFIFSVPTTWPVVPTVESFKSIVSRSGFGSHPTHAGTYYPPHNPTSISSPVPH